jgi:hypothetical protein
LRLKFSARKIGDAHCGLTHYDTKVAIGWRTPPRQPINPQTQASTKEHINTVERAKGLALRSTQIHNKSAQRLQVPLDIASYKLYYVNL